MLRILIVALTLAGMSLSLQATAETLHVSIPQPLVQGADALEAGNLPRAEKMLKKALRLNLAREHRHVAENGLCITLWGRDRAAEALRHCDNAIRLNGQSWRAHNNRGTVLYALGEFTAARDAFERALRIRPTDTALNGNLALAVTMAEFQVASDN